MKAKLLLLALLISLGSFAQKDSSVKHWKLSGYLETFFGIDPGNSENKTRPSFLYSYNRNRQPNLNLGFIKASYDNSKIRANLALMAGTYSRANLSSEPGLLKNIFEANVGVKVSRKQNLWLDMGVFPSHIGFESAIGKDCWTLTRSILAENSPYYESGVKLSFLTKDEKWQFTALLLNGWQHIKPLTGYRSLGVGHQIVYKPRDRVLLNSSSFIGVDAPDTAQVLRIFHNLYSQIQVSDNIGLILGLDIGGQQRFSNKSKYDLWWAPVIMTKMKLHKKITMALRGEYYADPQNVIINASAFNNFKTFGYSLNFDYQILNNLVWRMEARSLRSRNNIFLVDNGWRQHYDLFTTAIAFSF